MVFATSALHCASSLTSHSCCRWSCGRAWPRSRRPRRAVGDVGGSSPGRPRPQTPRSSGPEPPRRQSRSRCVPQVSPCSLAWLIPRTSGQWVAQRQTAGRHGNADVQQRAGQARHPRVDRQLGGMARQWDRFRTVWLPEDRMWATWFQGTYEEFIAANIAGYAKGVRIYHFLGGCSIDIKGEKRAIAQTEDVDLAARRGGRRRMRHGHASAGSTTFWRSAGANRAVWRRLTYEKDQHRTGRSDQGAQARSAAARALSVGSATSPISRPRSLQGEGGIRGSMGRNRHALCFGRRAGSGASEKIGW